MGIRDTISKKKKANTTQKLYKHWLEEDATSKGDVSNDSPIAVQEKLDDQTRDKYDSVNKRPNNIQDFQSIELDDNSISFDIPARYILQGVFVVSLLLIMLSVMLTILLSRSCS